MTDMLDKGTVFHCIRTSIYAVKISFTIKGKVNVLNTWLSAILHDIGKMKVPKSILNKPDRLTEEEMTVMRKHAGKGAEILRGKLPLSIIEPIRYHHENIDGSGYYGACADSIPEVSKIIRVCDVYDSLITKRPYKEPWTKKQALDYLKEKSGTLFDPVYVEILCEITIKSRKKFCLD